MRQHSAFLCLWLGLSPLGGRAATYVVNSSVDRLPMNLTVRVEGSFRQAIADANAAPGTNNILFKLPGGTAIVLTNVSLPAIVYPININGLSQIDGALRLATALRGLPSDRARSAELKPRFIILAAPTRPRADPPTAAR